jgi:translocation and assembly module TamB
VGDVEINVIVKGLLKEPEIAFRSNPPKSSREILSLVLFNKGTGDINIEESQELSRNLIKLSDQVASGPNLLERFRSSLGIDRIDITATDSDEMSLRVGKYLTNRLFLSLKKSMDDQPNQASLEADLTNNFKAQAEVGDDAEARLLLKWEKDY